MKKHPLDKPILKHVFAFIIYHHLIKEQESLNREINMFLNDLKKREPKEKIEKLRKALSNLVMINELKKANFSEDIGNRWENEYIEEAKAILKETK